MKPLRETRLPAHGRGPCGWTDGRALAGSSIPARRLRARPAAFLLPVICLSLSLTLLTSPGRPTASALAAPGQPGQPILSIGVSPVITAYDLRRGETVTVKAIFSSGGTESFQAQVYLYDALRRGTSGFEFTEPGAEFWSAGGWLTADPVAFPMQPNERREVLVKLTVPKDTPSGEYYAAFGVTATPDTVAGPSSASVQVNGSVISVICVAIGEGLDRSARLIPYGDVPRDASPTETPAARLASTLRHWWLSLVIGDWNVAHLAEGQVFRVFAPIENTGGVHIQPRVTATFLKGDRVVRGVVVSGQIILPGDKELVEIPWADAPFYGRYRIDLEVEYGGPEPIKVSRSFFILPVKGIVGIVLLASGLGYFMARRERKKATPVSPSRGLPA